MKWTVILTLLLSLHEPIMADEPGKNGPQPRSLLAKIGTLRDGGSSVIEIPAHGGKPACTIYVDRRLRSKTTGEIFSEKDFDHEQRGTPLPWEQANERLKQLEQVLIARYGPEKLLELVLNPIEPGGHISEEEFGKRMVDDPGFNESLDARYLMTAIIDYRT